MKKINYEKLKKSLDELKEQYENFLTVDEQDLSEVNKKAVKHSVIKCFEICHDTLWKHLKKFMQEAEHLVGIPNSPNGIFRKAHESGMIDQAMQERLIEYNEIRGDAAHDYDVEKAEAALGKIGDFIQDAEEIYQTMSKEQ